MKVAIIANPITGISSGKFLDKILSVFSMVFETVYVINDGVLINGAYHNVYPIASTRFLINITKSTNKMVSDIATFIFGQIGFTWGLYKCRKDIDAVIFFPITMVIPLIFAKLLKKTTILYEAQDILHEPISKSVLVTLKNYFLLLNRSIFLYLIDEIIVEGESVVKHNKLEAYRDKIHVCPQYVSIEKYRKIIDFDCRKKMIGYISSLNWRKGSMEYAYAVKKLCSQFEDLHFIIVGDGPLKNDIRKELNEYCSSGRVSLYDNLSDDELIGVYNNLCLYVLPSRSEGLPNAILESMACGTPVLATPVGAIPDVIIDCYSGFLMEEVSPDCICKNVIRSLNYDNLNEISQNGMKIIQCDYTYSKTCERYLQLFNRLV